MDTKICHHCQEELPLAAFWRNKNTSDGRKIYCKVCDTKVQREARQRQRMGLAKSQPWPHTPYYIRLVYKDQQGYCLRCEAQLGRRYYIHEWADNTFALICLSCRQPAAPS